MLCISHVIVLYRIPVVRPVNMHLFARPRLASFLRLCVRRRRWFGAPRPGECVGVLLPPPFAHLHSVRVGKEGKAVRGEMVPLFVAVDAVLLLHKNLLSKSVRFAGHGLAREVEGMAGAGSRAWDGGPHRLGR